MNYKERISADYRVMLGKPVIKETRITVEIILKNLSEGAKIQDVLEMYPGIKEEDVYAVLAYACESVASEELLETH